MPNVYLSHDCLGSLCVLVKSRACLPADRHVKFIYLSCVQVLNEFARAFLPARTNSNSVPKHVRVLGAKAPAVLTAGQCSDVDYSDCSLTSSFICPMLHL
jgi:hypothetical protein